ncbi:hypothetical protein M103_3289 [Bacteroides fragilis str. 1007-1-F |nr:hypothetical protein M103_3289 [Bacteroides fragilis str. 1007-1-F \
MIFDYSFSHNLRPPGADCLHSPGVERGFSGCPKDNLANSQN